MNYKLKMTVLGETPMPPWLLRLTPIPHTSGFLNLNIDKVAEQTGFPNRFYFSRVFKVVSGETPAQFRSKYGSAPEA